MSSTGQCGETFTQTPELQVTGPMGNIFFRPMRFERAGDVVLGHTHNFDHVTFLWRGKIEVTAHHVDNPEATIVRQFEAPARILIRKDWCHSIKALQDRTFADCIYALRDFDGEVTSHFNGDLFPYQ